MSLPLCSLTKVDITNFFRRRGLETVLTTRELFDFITDITITNDNLEAYLRKMKLIVEARQGAEKTPEEETEDNIFRNPALAIPRSLRDIQDPFVLSPSNSYHQALTGQRADLSGPRMVCFATRCHILSSFSLASNHPPA
jgi:RIO kinase 1